MIREIVFGESPDANGLIEFNLSDIDVWVASAFFDLVGHRLGAGNISCGDGDSCTFGRKCTGGFGAEPTRGTRYYCDFTGQVYALKYISCGGLLAESSHYFNLNE